MTTKYHLSGTDAIIHLLICSRQVNILQLVIQCLPGKKRKYTEKKLKGNKMLISNFKAAYFSTIINTTDHYYINLYFLCFKVILWQRTNQIKMSQPTYQGLIKCL